MPWSSPVCVYNKDGSGKVLYCNSTGDIRLLDGKTGKQEDVLSVSDGVIEASPAVYDNYAVVGTRDCKIWGSGCGKYEYSLYRMIYCSIVTTMRK